MLAFQCFSLPRGRNGIATNGVLKESIQEPASGCVVGNPGLFKPMVSMCHGPTVGPFSLVQQLDLAARQGALVSTCPVALIVSCCP